MTLPVNVRVNAKVNFPTSVSGSGFVTVSKSNGVWTVSVDYTKLSSVVGNPDPSTKQVAVFDPTAKQFALMTLAAVLALGANVYRTVTADGDVTIGSTDRTILLNKTTGAATNIVLPLSAQRNGVPVSVKDLKGDSQTNNITFVPSGSETIDGFSAADAAANGLALIATNYGAKTLYPLTSGGWYLL